MFTTRRSANRRTIISTQFPMEFLAAGWMRLKRARIISSSWRQAAVTPEERNALLQDAHNEILGLTRNGNQTAIVGDPRLAADRRDLHPMHALASARIERDPTTLFGPSRVHAVLRRRKSRSAPDRAALHCQRADAGNLRHMDWRRRNAGSPAAYFSPARTPLPLYVLSTTAIRYRLYDFTTVTARTRHNEGD